jgi:hypothetical protein
MGLTVHPSRLKTAAAVYPRTCHLDRSVPGFPTSLHLTTTTNAALSKEGRTHLTDHATLDRQSGGSGVERSAVPFQVERMCF